MALKYVHEIQVSKREAASRRHAIPSVSRNQQLQQAAPAVKVLRIATRGTKLALEQARQVMAMSLYPAASWATFAMLATHSRHGLAACVTCAPGASSLLWSRLDR